MHTGRKTAAHLPAVVAVVAATCMGFTSMNALAQQQKPWGLTTTKLLRDEATFQLALTLKLRADQSFLDGDRATAKDLYAKSQTELGVLGEAWKADYEARVEMLVADIAYRQKLLEHNADFWGATFSLKPIHPVEAFTQFESDLSSFEAVVSSIQQAKDQLSTAVSASSTLEAYRAAANTDADVTRLQSITEDIKGNNHADKATAAQGKIDTNIRRQREIANERVQLAKQFDAAHKTFDSLVLNFALQAAGVPPEMQQLADGNKPLEQRILNAAGKLVVDNGPLFQSFGKLSETTANIVQTAQELQKDVEAVQKLKATSEAAVTAVRKGTIEGALEAGTIIYGQLPKADQDQLKKLVVDQAKPVVALVETAHRAKATLDTVVKAVADSDEMKSRMQALLEERLRENAPAFDQWYRKQLQAVMRQVDVPDLRLAEQAVQAWPKAFFSQLSPSLKEQLRAAAGASSYEEAAKAIFSTWPPLLASVQMDGASLQVSIGATKELIDLRTFVDKQVGLSLEAVNDFAEESVTREATDARDRMTKKVLGMVEPAMRQKDLFVKRFAEELHSLDESTSLVRLLPPNVVSNATTAKDEAGKLFDSIWAQLPADSRPAATIQLAAVQTGAIAGKKILAADARQIPRGGVGTGGGSGAGSGAQQKAIMEAAVSAAFPAAGVAIQAVKFIDAFGKMHSLADQINRRTAEDRAIMAEQLALYDLVRDERAAVVLADMGKRVADLRHTGAISQAERFGQAVWQMDVQAMRAVGAQRLFAPRAFLLAESLRARYDQLDRSLAFWTGDPSATRGYLARLTSNDPQYLRYELDPAIQAFSWLDRSAESDRGDLPKLAEEWRRKHHFAKLACDKLGCLASTAQVGQITLSAPELSLRTLVPTQWAKFEQWKASNPPADEFTFEFLLTPAMLNPHKEHHNLRFVTARAALKQGTSFVTPGGNALRHSGAAYVPFEDTYVKEHYSPDALFDLTDRPFPDDLAKRWGRPSRLQPLEGYGVYTLWRFSLRNASANRSAEDVVLQFSYQYQLKERVIDDSFLAASRNTKSAWSLVYQTADKLPIKIGVDQLPFFAEDSRALQTLKDILKEPQAQQAGIGQVSLEESKGRGK